jgi:cell division protein FtsB
MGKKKSWIYAAVFFAWVICISGVFGNSGLLQAYRLSSVRHDLNLRVKALENERQRLQATLLGLEHDSYLQEQAVRETLGLVRADELIFEFR